MSETFIVPLGSRKDVNQPVSGPLTDTQLRATAVPVSLSSDIQIGAVELKNGADDTRATITVANALKVDGSAVTQPVSAASLPLPSGASTAALQTQPGVDIGDVTINNASGASAVNIQDGGNSITVDGTVTANPTTALTVGTHANAWNAAVTRVNGVSTAIDCQYVPFISIFGNLSGTSTLTVQYSQDNTNFYDVVSDNVVGGGNFGFDVISGARYVRLKSSLSVTATATIAGKN